MRIDRRTALLWTAAAAAAPALARAGEIVELEWGDLIPDGGGDSFDFLRSLGVVEHGQLDGLFAQQVSAELTREFDGKRVSLPGFAIPLQYDGTGTTVMILAPYVGACIHVPPPPPNQLVLVTSQEPQEVDELFQPVVVTGLFGTAAVDAGLAEIGYTLEAERIRPHEG